jgi:phosphatidylinositol alpha-mannosyltransferase
VFQPGHAPIRHLRDDRVNILFVGRLEKRKGLSYLLRAYESMKVRVPNSRLIVVGDGPLHGNVESYISRHRVPDVVMAGYVPDTVLPRYYCSADIFCAPATGAESFGIVLLEAMATGLPVVATEIDGYMSVLEPGRDSLTVKPKSPAELGAALVILARDQELRRRMGAYGLKKARHYAWEEVASQVLDVYNEARHVRAERQRVGSREVMNVHDAV